MLDTLLAVKFVLTVLVVLAISWIAEKFSPRIAGFIAGLPTGQGVMLFFFGLEQGTQFAADSTIYNIAGFVANLTQFYVYYRASLHFKRHPIVMCIMSSLAAYFLVAFVLRQIDFSVWTASLLLLAALAFYIRLYKDIPNIKIKERIKLTKRVIAFRALLAAGMVIAVTGTAPIVGPTWAGLLSAISVTTFPLFIIIHHTYGLKPLHTIMKNFPIGLPAMLVYSFTAHFAFPAYGIYLGTAAAYAATAAYLVAYVTTKKRWAWLP